MKKRFLIFCLCFGSFSLPLLYAQTYVNSILDLQNAIQNASGNTIIKFNDNFNNVDFSVDITINHSFDIIIDGTLSNGKSIELYALPDSKHFSILKNSTNGNITFRNIIFKGLRTETNISDNTSGVQGGGVVITSTNGKYLIVNTRFVFISGGALQFGDNQIEIKHSTFIANYNNNHGGAIVGTGDLYIRNCTFFNNRSWLNGFSGGAIGSFNSSGIIDIKASAFIQNGAFTRGGAIAVENSNGLQFKVDSCFFKENYTENYNGDCDGGAVSIFGDNTHSVQCTILNSTFYKNHAGDDGGAIYIQNQGPSSSNLVRNCTMHQNWSLDKESPKSGSYILATSGGAIQLSLKTTISIENNTITQNYNTSSFQRGGGIGVSGASNTITPTIQLYNNIIVGNYILNTNDNSQITNNHSNVGGKIGVTNSSAKVFNNNNSNVGFDNGSAAIPEGVSLINTIGTNNPLLSTNYSTIKAGNPNENDPLLYHIIPTIPILPNDGSDLKGIANGFGKTPYPEKDARGYIRGNEKEPTICDAGAVEVTWSKFDANGGEFLSTLAEKPFEGGEFYVKNASNKFDKYYQIDAPGSMLTTPRSGIPFRKGFLFQFWAFDQLGNNPWDENISEKEAQNLLFAIWKELDTLPQLCEGNKINSISLSIDDVSALIPGSEKWILNGEAIDTSTYILSSANHGDTLYYEVETYCSGIIKSNPLILKVGKAPEITSFNHKSVFCTGDSLIAIIEVNKNNLPIISWEWKLDNNVINNGDTTEIHFRPITRTDHGKEISITVTNACGSDTKTYILDVEDYPSFTFDKIIVCGTNTVDLTTLIPTTGSITDLTLSYYSDENCLNSFPNKTTAGSGTYYIVGINSNGCSDTAKVEINISTVLPLITGPVSVCGKDTITLTGNGTTAGDKSFIWEVDGGIIVSGSGTNEIQVFWTNTGIKNITLQYKNTEGCEGISNIFNINIFTKPDFQFKDPTLIFSTTTSLQSLELISGSVSGLSLSYYTDRLCTTSVENTLQVVPSTYYIVGTNNNGCSDTTKSTIVQLPIPRIVLLDSCSLHPKMILDYEVQDGNTLPSYEWQRSENDGVSWSSILGANQSYYYPNMEGTYKVKITFSSGDIFTEKTKYIIVQAHTIQNELIWYESTLE